MVNPEILVNSDSEEEIFFGPIRSPERRKAALLQNRKTEVFEAPLYIHQQPDSMAPREEAARTYSKVPNPATETEAERKQRIKQRPQPLPPFSQLYCTKDGQSINSPFHLLTNTKDQANNLGGYMSTKGISPLPSPHRHSVPLPSSNMLMVPCQQLGRLSLSPGLNPSFYYDSFDKLRQYNGHVGGAEDNIFDSSCGSLIEDVMSPAGLLFCSPLVPSDLPKKVKKQNGQITKTTTRKPTSSVQYHSKKEKHGQQSRDPISTPSNGYICNLQGIGTPRKTPDLFFTSKWVTRRRNYGKIRVTEINSTEKVKLHRSSSVPEIHVIHPEESDHSFMSASISSHLRVSESSYTEYSNNDVDDMIAGTPGPEWLLKAASALNHSLCFSDSDISTNAESPSSPDLGKTFDTVSTLTPIFSKHISKFKGSLPTLNIQRRVISHH